MLYIGAFHKLSLMASKPKPSLLHQVAGTRWESIAKKPRMMTTDSSMSDAFSKYADYLNNLNEKRERVVKASRDITMNSKKVIFQVHRIGKQNKDAVLEKAEKDLQAVRDLHVSRLVKELNGSDFWKLRRAYSPGIQEYVEAATFCKFCRTGALLNLDEINATFSPLSELMRLAISRISDGEVEFAEKICGFVRDIHRQLTLLVPSMDDSSDMKQKMDTMLQSVMKIENACFSVHVRGSEYIPLLGSSDPSYSLMGVTGIEL
ncbi:hypothetical protein KSS87_013795 [Heliosperma pusillum]|nr:hypothetical protein KSS87_013795 [Heliosperma pusillum]